MHDMKWSEELDKVMSRLKDNAAITRSSQKQNEKDISSNRKYTEKTQRMERSTTEKLITPSAASENAIIMLPKREKTSQKRVNERYGEEFADMEQPITNNNLVLGAP